MSRDLNIATMWCLACNNPMLRCTCADRDLRLRKIVERDQQEKREKRYPVRREPK